MHSYQEPKSPRESHPSARRREPQAGAGQANGPVLLPFWADNIRLTAFMSTRGRFSGKARYWLLQNSNKTTLTLGLERADLAG